MRVVYSIEEDSPGRWCIRVADRMTLAQAISHARKLARDHHANTGQPSSVEMVSPESTITLARYARAGLHAETEAA